MARIKNLDMSVMNVMIEMADGNPGAATVMMMLIENTEKIDPQNIMRGLGVILSLDTHEIYGPRIWMLYKDVAKEDIGIMIGLLRAVQLGFIAEGELQYAIDRYGADLDIPSLIKQVQVELPDFDQTL